MPPLTPSIPPDRPARPAPDSPPSSCIPSRAKHLTWHPTPHIPPPLLTFGAPQESPPAKPRSARQAHGSLPAFGDGGAPLRRLTSRDVGPLSQALQAAEQGSDVQPLIEALREWPSLRQRLTAPVDDNTGSLEDADDIEVFERQALRRVLALCATRELDGAQLADLLRAAHPLLSPIWTCDALLRSDYADALHRWLEPDEAARLLQTNGLPTEQLPLGHPYQERQLLRQTLIYWGLPETAAQQLPAQARYTWAHHQLFDGASPPVRTEGDGLSLRFQGQTGAFDNVQVDAVLAVCKAWLDAQCPTLALALMTATRHQSLTDNRDIALLGRWQALWLTLKRRTAAQESAPAVPLPDVLRKVFAPWLTVSLTINPATARTTDIACVADVPLAANAKRDARQRVLDKLTLWLEAELHDRNGLPWPLLVKLLESIEAQLGTALALPSTQWLKMAMLEFDRSGNAEPLLFMLSSLSVHLRRMEDEGHQQPLLDEALLDKVFRLAQQAGLDAVSRANLIQNALPLLPQRDGPGAESHAACLLAVLAQDDLLIRGTLFDAYRERYPFDRRKSLLEPLKSPRENGPPQRRWDPTPRLFMLASQLDQPERLGSASTWTAFGERLPRPGRDTAWPLWRALCRELGVRMVPRILEVQQSTRSPQEKDQFNQRILHALNRLSEHKGQPGLSAEHQAELLADLAEAMPSAHRRAFLEQLDGACRDLIERSPMGDSGEPLAPVPPWQIALRGAVLALIDRLGDGPQRAPASRSRQALDADTRFFRDWFAARLADRPGGAPYQGPDLKTLKLQHEISNYEPLRQLFPAPASPLESLITGLFALHALK